MISRTRAFSLALLLTAAGACSGYVTPGGGISAELTFVDRSPPPPRREARDRAPGRDHAWVAGHWQWRGNDYEWVPGAWVRMDTGNRQWVAGQWRHERRGWFWVEGHWR
jgi:hypothetical protein